MLKSLLARPRVLVGSLLAVGAVALVAHPTLARSIGADVWNVPALKEQVREATAEDDRLNDEDGDVRRRIAIKDAVVADLIASRITLAEATDQFVALNAARPRYMRAIREGFPGATDQEKCARNVISFAIARVEARDRSDLSSRLETDLRQMLAAGASH